MERKNVPMETVIAREKIKISIFSMLEAVFLIGEIYVMARHSDELVIIGCFAFAMILDLLFLTNAIINYGQKNKELERATYESIYKAQKASYLVIRKSFEEMKERLNHLEENTAIPTDEIISAQKAVAKVTISRSKENTDALMNSNDELINHISGFEEKLHANNKEILDHQQELLEKTKEDILAKNKELEERFEVLHNALAEVQQNLSELELQREMPAMENPDSPEDNLESTVDDELEENNSLKEAVPDEADPNRVMSAEEIEALFANL